MTATHSAMNTATVMTATQCYEYSKTISMCVAANGQGVQGKTLRYLPKEIRAADTSE